MSLISLHSLDDTRLAPFRSLKETNASRREGLFITEGDKLLERLLESDCAVVSILLDERQQARFAERIPDSIPTYVIPGELVEQLVGYNFHRGAIGCGRRKPARSLPEFMEQVAAPSDAKPLRIVIACEVQNPENLGALLRLSAAFGVDGVALTPGSADPYSRRVLRVSMGATFRVPILESRDLVHDLSRMHEQYSVVTYATALDPKAVPLANVRPPERTAILFGSEGHGLPENVLAACKQRIWIPMVPGTDSLNVAVTAGIVLYHFAQSSRPMSI